MDAWPAEIRVPSMGGIGQVTLLKVEAREDCLWLERGEQFRAEQFRRWAERIPVLELAHRRYGQRIWVVCRRFEGMIVPQGHDADWRRATGTAATPQILLSLFRQLEYDKLVAREGQLDVGVTITPEAQHLTVQIVRKTEIDKLEEEVRQAAQAVSRAEQVIQDKVRVVESAKRRLKYLKDSCERWQEMARRSKYASSSLARRRAEYEEQKKELAKAERDWLEMLAAGEAVRARNDARRTYQQKKNELDHARRSLRGRRSRGAPPDLPPVRLRLGEMLVAELTWHFEEATR
jgi:hypothetical protein